MNRLKVGSAVVIEAGDWEGMTGVVDSIWETNCIVVLGTLIPSSLLISIKDLELVES